MINIKETIKKTVAMNGTFRAYDDGSVEVDCSVCNKHEELKPDGKWAKILRENVNLAASYKCYDCWKKDKNPEQGDREEKITRRQGLNVAIALMPEDVKRSYWESLGVDREITTKLIQIAMQMRDVIKQLD